MKKVVLLFLLVTATVTIKAQEKEIHVVSAEAGKVSGLPKNYVLEYIVSTNGEWNNIGLFPSKYTQYFVIIRPNPRYLSGDSLFKNWKAYFGVNDEMLNEVTVYRVTRYCGESWVFPTMVQTSLGALSFPGDRCGKAGCVPMIDGVNEMKLFFPNIKESD